MSKFRNLLADLFKTDKEKLRDRKTRIQHPHMVDAKRHWDWDTGYADIDTKKEDK
jgi:hypothetical protein